ncbi:c-type cytochrome [Hydrogenimonas sp.]
MRAERVLLVLLPIALCSSEGVPGTRGESIYMSMGCYGCHGVAGEGVNDFPKLAGKPAAYLADRLRDLKRGKGRTPRRQMMIPFAKALEERDIVAVSDFLSGAGGSEKSESMDVPEDILGGNN